MLTSDMIESSNKNREALLPNQNNVIDTNVNHEKHLQALFDDFKNEETSQSILPEKEIHLTRGSKVVCIILLTMLLGLILTIVFAVVGAMGNEILLALLEIPILIFIVPLFFCCCFVTISPGSALVVSFFGTYVGTCRDNGWFWVKPCSNTNFISVKSNHYNGNMIKVNDKEGTPVLLGIIFVWKIKDSVKVIFGVNDYMGFITTQTESAVRYIGNKFPYDSKDPNETTLKSGREEINHLLKLELQRRVSIAGIEIEDARITEISYSAEIAQVMLKKQAAESIVISKDKISKGSIDIIENSIKELEARRVCKFTDDEKAELASNMLMILNVPQGNSSYVKINIGPGPDILPNNNNQNMENMG